MTSFPETKASDMPNSLLGQFLAFLRRPHDPAPEHRPKGAAIKSVLNLYSLDISLTTLVIGMLILLRSLVDIETSNSSWSTDLANGMILQVFLFAVILVPLFEEMVFRLPLRYRPLNVTLSLTLGQLLILAVLVDTESVEPWYGLAMIAVIFLSLPLYFGLRYAIEPIVAKVWLAKHLKVFVYGTSIAFGVIHITNYPVEAWFFMPILVLSQLISGFFLAFIRLYYGFHWAFLTHAFHNFILGALLFFPLSLGSQQLKDQILDINPDAKLLSQDYLLIGITVVVALTGIFGALFNSYRLWRAWYCEKQALRQMRLRN